VDEKQKGGLETDTSEKTKPSLSELINDPQYKTALEDLSRPYAEIKGLAAMIEIYKNQYPDPEQLAKRMEELKVEYNSVKEEIKKNDPGRSDEAYSNFALNKMRENLPQSEKQSIEKWLDANYQKLGNTGGRMITAALPFGDFIKIINKTTT
jgi:hypothetical protein